MNVLTEALANAEKIAIVGHVHPDGDCVGSCLGLRQYLSDNMPEKTVTVYLEPITKNLQFLHGSDVVAPIEAAIDFDGDLCISMDVSSTDRLGEGIHAFQHAKHTLVIDHHVTNPLFGEKNCVDGDASSCCQVLYELLDDNKISRECAEALYTGIVHDTGVFKYSSTKERTMQIAGRLMSKGLNTAEIIDHSFYQKSLLQTKVMALVVSKAEMYLDNKLFLGILSNEDMQMLHATAADCDGVIDQLRLVKGVEVAAFAREDKPGTFKFSLRSNGKVDVSAISSFFGGGGHRMAAGFTVTAELDDLKNQLNAMILLQL